MHLNVIILLLTSVSYSYTANILAIMPIPSYSHQIALTDLWRELSLRGHSVTVITTDPLKDAEVTNLTEIDVKWSYKYMADFAAKVPDLKTFSMWNMARSLDSKFIPMVDEQLKFGPIQELLQDRSKKFDLVIVEHLCPEYLGFAELYNTPKVLVSTMVTWSYLHKRMGNVVHPVLHPDLFSYYFGRLSFKERVMSTWYSWYAWLYIMREAYPKKEKTLHRHFNMTTPLVDLLTDIDLLIFTTTPIIHGVRAGGPTTISIGGYRPGITSSPPLPKDIQEFLDEANEGFIYLSLGSNAKSKELGKKSLDSIISTLSELPYKVLWKFEADTLPGKPTNIKLVKWAPQQSVLRHPNIRLFITQGGLQSMEEGIYNEVPFVVIPHFGDQPQNAIAMQSRGIAKIVYKDPFIKKEELKASILEVIQNPRYKATVQKIKRLTLDTPMSGLDLAVWWIEHVIRNNGTKHLRNPVLDLPTYQYYLLDVLGFFILVAILSLLIIVKSTKFLHKIFTRHIHRRFSKLKSQ